jgi:hypothetical protein
MADYSEKFIDQCFYVYYDSDRTVGNALIDKLPENEEGKKPGIFTVKRWVEEKGWIERADALDAEVSIQVEKSVIQKRVEMYEKHAKLADELITMGREFLQKQVDGGGLKTENAALRAIELGFQTERVSVGVSDMVRKIGEMTPDQLDNELRKLLGQKQENEFIEGETIESDTVSKETND